MKKKKKHLQHLELKSLFFIFCVRIFFHVTEASLQCSPTSQGKSEMVIWFKTSTLGKQTFSLSLVALGLGKRL